jgi:hypothetical protein
MGARGNFWILAWNFGAARLGCAFLLVLVWRPPTAKRQKIGDKSPKRTPTP